MYNIISIPKVAPSEHSPLENEDSIITNNGFFPDIHLIDVRNSMRIDGTVTNDRLKHAVIEAMLTVNQELQSFKDVCLAQDKVTLNECNEEKINGEVVQVYQYKRAVYCFAVANLYERYRSFDSTKEGVEKAEYFENSVDDLRRDGRFAIRDIIKRKRWTTELI